MALREALKRFRVPHVETVEQVRGVLDDIEQAYNQLLFYLEQQAPLTPNYMTAGLSVAQTANLAAGNHIEFDTVVAESGHITLSTGEGQQRGIFTLPNGTWLVSLDAARVNFSATTGEVILSVTNTAGGVLSTRPAHILPTTSTQNSSSSQITSGIITVADPLDIELRISAPVSSVTSIGTTCALTIFALA